MIYNGDYQNNTIYGTANNHKLKVNTADDANFMICELAVNYNGIDWSHTFEAPFFNNNAELYIENYIHSIITQNFDFSDVDINAFKLYHFSLAQINITLKEMLFDEELDTLDLTFKMVLGNFNETPELNITNGAKILLPITQTSFFTSKGVLCISFIASETPEKLIVNDGNLNTENNLPLSTSNLILHTLVIPLKLCIGSDSTALEITLEFSDQSTLQLGTYSIIDDSIDHSLMWFQNDFGTLSCLEFIGELKIDDNFKYKNFEYSENNINRFNTTEITYNTRFNINTGYIIDHEKYTSLYSLLKSFQIFLLRDSLIKVLSDGNQKLMSFKSNYYLNNETLKFKTAQNDNIHYRVF